MVHNVEIHRIPSSLPRSPLTPYAIMGFGVKAINRNIDLIHPKGLFGQQPSISAHADLETQALGIIDNPINIRSKQGLSPTNVEGIHATLLKLINPC